MGRNIEVSQPLGPMGGVLPPIWMSGKTITPHYTQNSGVALNTTATRLYYVPFYLSRLQTFAGIRTYNSSTGDNTETYRCGIYNEATAGGPGALLDDCGEITLNNTSAIRSAASSFTNTVLGWHYLALHFNSAIAMYRIFGYQTGSDAGYIASPLAQQLGTLGNMITSISSSATPTFDYVDTSYGALAATAVTPTATTNIAPSCALYV